MILLSIKDLVYSAMVNVADGGCWSLTCDYRIYSNKRRGAYLIFRATSAALIRLIIVPDRLAFAIFSFNGTLSIC